MKRMNGHKGPPLDKARSRRDAAKVLGVALQARYRKYVEASGDNEVVIATADLAQCMIENIEFIVWSLKSLGGMNPPPPEQLRRITPPTQPANDPRFAKPPEIDLAEDPVKDECTCPPLEHGIIGRERHMTSCPKFVP